MKKTTRKLLAMALAVIMAVSMIPAMALAADTVDSGKCGENVTWTLDSDGVLTISGTGEMSPLSQEAWSGHAAEVKRVIVESGVTSLSIGAFTGLENLTYAYLPDAITSLQSTFRGLASLAEVRLPTGLTEIGDYTFYGCSSLEMLEIPETVTSLGYSAFMLSGLRSIDLPAGIDSIPSGCFQSCRNLEEIVIPPVAVIGENAFDGCIGLTELVIPASVGEIKYRAFSDCIGLSTVRFDGKRPKIGRDIFRNDVFNGYYPQNDASWVPVVEGEFDFDLGGTITWLSYDPNEEFKPIESDGLIDSGELTDTISWKLDKWGVLTLTGTGEIYVQPNSLGDLNYPWRNNVQRITKIVIEEGITSTGQNAFWGANVKEVVLPDTVKTISDNSFYNCHELTTIELPDGLEKIGSSAFTSCTALTHMEIPSTVKELGDSAFRICYSISGTIVLPDGLTAVPEEVFYDCEKLERVVIPDSVTEIMPGAFFRCYAMKSIELPEGLEIIDNWAFDDCEGLESIVIPPNVKSIGRAAFRYCESMTQVVFTGNAPAIAEDAFKYVTADVYIPVDNDTWTDDMIRLYGGDLTWYTYDPNYEPSIIQSGSIGEDLFWRLWDNGELDIVGWGVIPDYAAGGENAAPWQQFKDGITYIVIDNGVTSIGANAFAGLTEVGEVDFLGNAPAIAENAFTGVWAYACCFIFDESWNEDNMLDYGGDLVWRYMYYFGDVDANGVVDNADLITLARYIVHIWPEDSVEAIGCEAFADMNRDGEVDNADLVELARYIVTHAA